MKKLWSILLAIAAVFVFVPPAAAVIAISGDSDGDEHPVLRWDQQINTASRFKVLSAFGSHAVLDNETGLVWQASPSKSTFSWDDAQTHCNQLTAGGRLGWRLPTVQELASLVDPNAPGIPVLPAGNPFSNVQSSGYWSANTLASDTNVACAVGFSNGFVGNVNKIDNSFAWCVRGGHGVDPQ